MSQSRPRFGCFSGTVRRGARTSGACASPLAPPQALDPLVVDLPAGIAQQGRDAVIAVTAVLAGQLDHVRNQAVLVVTTARDAALGRAVLPQHLAGAAFRDPEPGADMIDALAAARGA